MESPTTRPELSPLKRAFIALEEMKGKLDAAERLRHEPIAIVGMACRFPAGANDPESFWNLLHEGVNGVSEIPGSRWNVEEYYDPDPDAAGKSYTRWAGLLDQVDRFEPQFFGISPREAVRMDPQQRLVLEVAWEALEAAAQPADKLQHSSTGVFLGLCTSDYATLQANSAWGAEQDAYTLSGLAHSLASGRVSYVLGLQGPSISLDTACSSSLVAVHLACQSLRADDCRMALAGGVHLILSPENSVSFSRLRMLAADGRCKTFDATADGFVEGEGCGLVVLKRLSTALADRDRILAVIRGSAVNQDGPSSGLTAPNGPAQESVVRTALSRAGLQGSDIDYVEAHGTGTSLGDPIELKALGSVLGKDRSPDRPLIVGSVKTNIGHLQAVAGIAGLMKLVAALNHEEIPPHLHFATPNPHLPWDRLPIRVATERVPWPSGSRPRNAGVSAFGFSGTNAHVIVGEAPPVLPAEAQVDRPRHLLTLSARSVPALTALAERWRTTLSVADDSALPDICFTANAGRAHLPHRIAFTAATCREAVERLQSVVEGERSAHVASGHVTSSDKPKIAFLFTGQGSQHAGMGRQLYETQPTFRAALDRCDAVLRAHLERPLLSVLYPERPDDTTIDQTAYTQPALFAVEYALAEMWRSWGVTPGALLGHSVGEYVAATVAGVFDLEAALGLVATRGRLMQALPAGGAMAAVLGDEATVRSVLDSRSDDIGIAAVNGPGNVVISGRAEVVDRVLARLKTLGTSAERLTVSHAFHSPLMDPILDPFERAVAGAHPAAATLTLISNLTGGPVRREVAEPGYWRRHLREPVMFARGIASLYDQGYRIFVEIGPRAVLCGMGQRCVPKEETAWLPSLRHGRDEWTQVLDTLGQLHVRGAVVDWSGFDSSYPRRKMALPTYPFERARYWIPDGAVPPKDTATRPGGHPLLGPPTRTALQQVIFERNISTEALPFLADHQKQGIAILPATAYLEIGLSAAREALGPGSYVVEELVISEALPIGPEMTTVQVIVSPDGSGASTFQLFSRITAGDARADRWRPHAAGTLRPADGDTPGSVDRLQDLQGRCSEALSVASYYEGLLEGGHYWGPAFQGIQGLWRGDSEALARIELPAVVKDEAGAYAIHPALLDAAMQILGAAIPADPQASPGEMFLPVTLGRCRVHRDGVAQGWSHVRLRDRDADGFVGDIRLYADDGAVVAEVVDIYNRRVPVATGVPAVPPSLYEPVWRQQAHTSAPGGAAPSSGTWVIVGQPGPVVTGLRQRFLDIGLRTVTAVPGGSPQAPATGHERGVSLSDPAEVARLLEEAGRDPRHPIAGVVHVSDIHEAGLGDPEADVMAMSARAGCEAVLHLIQALATREWPTPPRLCVVTCGAMPVAGGGVPTAVSQAPLWGLMRTAAAEFAELRCMAIDLDPRAPEGVITQLAAELLHPGNESQVAFRDNVRYVARLARGDGADASHAGQADNVTLGIPEAGTLDRLALAPSARRPPGPGEIEIRVLAAGLNFRDVLNALGMYAGEAGPLGRECVGTVVAVGSGVDHVQVGDQVMGMGLSTFSRYVTAQARGFVVKPSNLDVEDAATIPVAFLTAEYGLNRLARMAAGDRVLIHAAAGGVGLACVRLAQRAGAEIFATAGSPEKHAYLKALGVQHVMSSRTLDFADEITALTGGAGVDIVMNALAGEFIEKSLSVLGQGGRFVEIGRAGIWTAEEMARVRPDVEYFPMLPDDDFSSLQPVLTSLAEAFRSGDLQPLPRKSFPLGNAIEGFRYMAQAKHIGKIVLTVESVEPAGAAPIVSDASYLVTGGLGALGLRVARWMVGAGARHVVLAGRGAPNADAASEIDALRLLGADVRVVQADVSRKADVSRLFEDITTHMPALRGVVHAAGAVDDGVLLQQTWERFEKVFEPKVQGAWYLHEQTRSCPLDFFVMFSSMVSILGGPGQASYAAANAFLDGLAHHRRYLGLPGLSINWGPWSGGGMASQVSDRDAARWAAQGHGRIEPEEGLAVLERLLFAGSTRPQVAVLKTDWTVLFRQIPVGSEPPFLSELVQGQLRPAGQASSGRRRLIPELLGLAPARRREVVRGFLRDEAVKVLGLDAATPVDTRQPLREFGLDSLMAVELRNVLATAMERTLPATLLFKCPTIEALTEYVLTSVEPEGEKSVHPAAVPEGGDGAELASLSDEDVRTLLAEELESLSAADWMTESEA